MSPIRLAHWSSLANCIDDGRTDAKTREDILTAMTTRGVVQPVDSGEPLVTSGGQQPWVGIRSEIR